MSICGNLAPFLDLVQHLFFGASDIAFTSFRHRRTLHSLIPSWLPAALLPICSAISTVFSLNLFVKLILEELLEGAILVVCCTVLSDNMMQGNPDAFTYWSVTRIACPCGAQATLIQGQHARSLIVDISYAS